MSVQSEDAYQETLQRLQNDAGAVAALRMLHERGSLAYLGENAYPHLNAGIVHWLVRAESHKGSELIYQTAEQKVKGLPLNSFFNFPDKYLSQIKGGAFISAELEDGSSIAIYLEKVSREAILEVLEVAKQHLALTTDRPIRERILDKLNAEGHASYLSRGGLEQLSTKLLKYLDYAVNSSPGSEMIVSEDDGSVEVFPIEAVIQNPERFENVDLPVYLTIEVDRQSVILDTREVTPANIWHLQKKARQIALNRAHS